MQKQCEIALSCREKHGVDWLGEQQQLTGTAAGHFLIKFPFLMHSSAESLQTLTSEIKKREIKQAHL